VFLPSYRWHAVKAHSNIPQQDQKPSRLWPCQLTWPEPRFLGNPIYPADLGESQAKAPRSGRAWFAASVPIATTNIFWGSGELVSLPRPSAGASFWGASYRMMGSLGLLCRVYFLPWMCCRTLKGRTSREPGPGLDKPGPRIRQRLRHVDGTQVQLFSGPLLPQHRRLMSIPS
jgi:hypothetical protein